MYFILWPNDNLMLVFGNANEFNLWGSYLLGLLCPKITCSNSKETVWLFHANLICGIYKITISIRVSCKPGFEPWASTVHAKCSGLWDDPYQALFLHACSSHETAPFMPSTNKFLFLLYSSFRCITEMQQMGVYSVKKEECWERETI